jgi:hypothetical protein
MGTATAASAKALAVTATGQVHCSMIGKVSYTPKLPVVAQSGVMAKFKASLTCSTGETGNAAITVVSGKLSGVTSTYNGGCLSANPPSLTATIKWKATGGKVNPTTITWGAATGNMTPVYSHDFMNGTMTGSYAGEQAGADFVADSVSSANCGTKGIKKWTFTNPANSLFDIAPGCGPISTKTDLAIGSNGHIWAVVVPQSGDFPTCATHPTGTLDAIVSNCGASASGSISDSGTNAGDQIGAGNYSMDLWGADTGLSLPLYESDGCPLMQPFFASSTFTSTNPQYSGF